jgi:hypothetical protein
MTKDTKRKSHSKLLPKITNGSSNMSNKLLAERSSSMGALESSSPHAPQASMTRKLTVVLQRRAPAKFPLLLTAISHQLPVMMKPAATHSTAPLRPLAFRTTAPPFEATHPPRVSQQGRRHTGERIDLSTRMRVSIRNTPSVESRPKRATVGSTTGVTAAA